MLNEWSEMPGIPGMWARAEPSREPSVDVDADAAARGADPGGEGGSPPPPVDLDRPVERPTPTRLTVAISEADLLTWFG